MMQSPEDLSQTCPSQIRSASQYFRTYQDVVTQLPCSAIDNVTTELLRAYEEERKVFVFGNGGSAALASHFACDLAKGTIINRNGQKRFRALALTDNVPLITAWANDDSYENIFAEQVQNLLMPRDFTFAISASGNSENVLRALQVGREVGAFNIGLAGFLGGKMKQLCDLCIVIPSSNMQVIEDLQLSITHAVFSVIRQSLFESMQDRWISRATASD